MRSARGLVTTKAIWPWVSTAALERPVVPEVKKNQQGSSYSTTASSISAPACAAIASLTDFSPNAPSPIRQMKASAGLAASAAAGAGGGGEIRNLVRHQPEIGRHPDRAEPERCKHRPEHLVAILGMDEDAVAFDDAARGKCSRQRRDETIDLAPAPGLPAPDQAGAVAVPAGIPGDEMREIHDP